MNLIQPVLLIAALICFLLHAGGVGLPRANLQSVGLALVTLAFLLVGIRTA